MKYSEDANNFYLNEQNKKKKKELEEKYGASFDNPGGSNIPPAIEDKFLNYVQQFEEQSENAEDIKLIEYLGNPIFKKLDEIEQTELLREIDNVLEIYSENQINVDIIEEDEVTEEDFYKFLTEELPQYVTQNMHVPGMTLNFIYEEFHPSNKLDAKQSVESTLFSAISKDRDFGMTYVAGEGLLSSDGESIKEKEFKEGLYLLFNDVEEVIEREVVFNNFEFGDENIVNADFILRYKKKNTSEEINKIFNFTFWLRRSEFEGMDIVRYRIL
ncbi:MAG TPA: hypothetical protein ENI61_04675 [Ignavibacteria bacterium]|nr:hypothetical protein [Ignavibacteria bacterium]